MSGCAHSLPVRDSLDHLAERHGLPPSPDEGHCTACSGAFSDEQVEARSRWKFALLEKLRRARKGAFAYDREEEIYQSLRRRYGGGP